MSHSMEASADRSVLVVEDHESVRTALRELLATIFPALRVLEVGDGRSALELLKAQTFALVLMDINLPDANGITLTREIKKLQPEAVVIVVSMLPAANYSEAALTAGAHAFVSKDNVFNELCPLIRQIVYGEPSS